MDDRACNMQELCSLMVSNFVKQLCGTRTYLEKAKEYRRATLPSRSTSNLSGTSDAKDHDPRQKSCAVSSAYWRKFNVHAGSSLISPPGSQSALQEKRNCDTVSNKIGMPNVEASNESPPAKIGSHGSHWSSLEDSESVNNCASKPNVELSDNQSKKPKVFSPLKIDCISPRSTHTSRANSDNSAASFHPELHYTRTLTCTKCSARLRSVQALREHIVVCSGGHPFSHVPSSPPISPEAWSTRQQAHVTFMLRHRSKALNAPSDSNESILKPVEGMNIDSMCQPNVESSAKVGKGVRRNKTKATRRRSKADYLGRKQKIISDTHTTESALILKTRRKTKTGSLPEGLSPAQSRREMASPPLERVVEREPGKRRIAPSVRLSYDRKGLPSLETSKTSQSREITCPFCAFIGDSREIDDHVMTCHRSSYMVDWFPS